MEWTQTLGTNFLRSTNGRYTIRALGSQYMLMVLDSTSTERSYWRSRPTIAACKRQADEKAAV